MECLGLKTTPETGDGMSVVAQAHNLLESVSLVVDVLRPAEQIGNRGVFATETGDTQEEYALAHTDSDAVPTDPHLKEIVEISNASALTSLPPDQHQAPRRPDHQPSGPGQGSHAATGAQQTGRQNKLNSATLTPKGRSEGG